MARECLLIDLSGSDLASNWKQDAVDEFPITPRLLTDQNELKQNLQATSVSSVVIFVSEYSSVLPKTLQRVFSAGFTPTFVAISCDQPDDKLLMTAFEFGIDEFISRSSWCKEASQLLTKWNSVLEDSSLPLGRIQKVHRTLALSKRPDLAKMIAALASSAGFNAEACWVKGKIHEADSSYKDAIDTFAAAKEINPLFRPPIMRLGELLLLVGKVDEALQVFIEMDASSPFHAERKGLLAMCYADKNDKELAQKTLKHGKLIDPNDLKLAEAEAQWLLKEGKVDEALALMEKLDEIGPFFAAKLNETGIKLSQEGEGAQAIRLYEKAHAIIHDSLKYKISMNLALAFRREKELKKAYSFAERCEAEYGGSFDKLDKVKITLKREMEQS